MHFKRRKTERILIIRIRLVFLHVDSKFGVPKDNICLKKRAVYNVGCVSAYFGGGHNNLWL